MAVQERILKSSVRRALDEIGDGRALLILLGALCGVQRFEEWKSLFGISPSILSDRLKQLVNNGILGKEPVEPGSSRSRYVLTDRGSDLFSWALAVWRWERDWYYRDADHPVHLVHTGCDLECTPRFVCSHCRKRLSYDAIVIEPGPGYDKVPMRRQPESRRSTGGSPDNEENAYVGRSIDILGDRWSFLLISATYFGVTRFDDFQSQLNIATNILSHRLRHLTDHGMFARNRYQERPPRYEYILTEKSIAYYQVPLTLALWCDAWFPLPSGSPFNRYHEMCGQPLAVTPTCSSCDDELRLETVRFLASTPARRAISSRG